MQLKEETAWKPIPRIHKITPSVSNDDDFPSDSQTIGAGKSIAKDELSHKQSFHEKNIETFRIRTSTHYCHVE